MNTLSAKHDWPTAFYNHARQHSWTALGLAIALLSVIALLVQSLAQIIIGTGSANVRLALLGGLAGFAATTLGALPALLLRSLPQWLEDSMLGLAAGMMLAASAFSLLLPGINAGEALLANRALGALVVVFGMALGVLLMLGLDQFTPHEHDKTGPCGPGHQTPATLGLMAGFALMMVLDTTLG